MTRPDVVSAVRLFLTTRFTDDELRQLCYDSPDFRRVYRQLKPGMAKSEIIERMLDAAGRQGGLEPLLAQAKAKRPDSPRPASAERPGPETPAPAQPGGSGGVKAGGSIRARDIVTGDQTRIQGADAETARAMLALAKTRRRAGPTGGVEAAKEIIAENIITGSQFVYLGAGEAEPDQAQFRQELEALKAQLAEAVQANEFADQYDAEDAQRALDRASQEAAAGTPAPDRLAGQLDRAASLLTKASEVAVAAGRFGARVIKLAPVVAGLKKLAEVLF